MLKGDAWMTKWLNAPSGTGVGADVELLETLFEALPDEPLDELLDEPLVEPLVEPLEDPFDEPLEPEEDERDDNTVEGVPAERLCAVEATSVETVPTELSEVRPDVLCAAPALPEPELPWI